MRGSMIWFNEEKDHGFISTEQGERLLVNGDAFVPGERPVGRCAGLVVEFDVSGAGGDRQAANCSFVTDEVAHRPRIRSSTRARS